MKKQSYTLILFFSILVSSFLIKNPVKAQGWNETNLKSKLQLQQIYNCLILFNASLNNNNSNEKLNKSLEIIILPVINHLETLMEEQTNLSYFDAFELDCSLEKKCHRMKILRYMNNNKFSNDVIKNLVKIYLRNHIKKIIKILNKIINSKKKKSLLALSFLGLHPDDLSTQKRLCQTIGKQLIKCYSKISNTYFFEKKKIK